MVSEIIKGQIARVNRDLAGDPQLASCQVRRFLVLHKELDADDGELTRTRKVRRGFIAERYLPLIDALYSGAASRSEEHTSELQSLMRISYAVFCLKKQKTITHIDIQ